MDLVIGNGDTGHLWTIRVRSLEWTRGGRYDLDIGLIRLSCCAIDF